MSSFRIIFSFNVSGLYNPLFYILTVSEHSFVPFCEKALSLSLSQVVVIHLFFAVLMADFSSFFILHNLWDDYLNGLEIFNNKAEFLFSVEDLSLTSFYLNHTGCGRFRFGKVTWIPFSIVCASSSYLWFVSWFIGSSFSIDWQNRVFESLLLR